MSELQVEFERIIEDTADGIHNSQEWWSKEYETDGETIIEGLCRRLEQAALNSKPRLPRVSPEGLVEGKWYWCKRKAWTGMGFTKNDSWGNKLTGSVAIWIGDVDFSPESFSAIWGPIPEFELAD